MPIGTIAIGGGFGTPLGAGLPSAGGGRSRSGTAVGFGLSTVSAVAHGVRARTGALSTISIVVTAVPGWVASPLTQSLAAWTTVTGFPGMDIGVGVGGQDAIFVPGPDRGAFTAVAMDYGYLPSRFAFYAGTADMVDFFFCCDSSGAGQFARVDVRGVVGPDHGPGLGTSSGWTSLTGPTGTITIPATPHLCEVVISATNQTSLYVDGVLADGPVSGPINGTWIGLVSDSGDGGWIELLLPLSSPPAGRVRSARVTPRVAATAISSGRRSRAGYALPSVMISGGGASGPVPLIGRWRLDDPVTNESYVFEINPNAGGSMERKRTMTTYNTSAPDGYVLTYEGPQDVFSTTFSGTVLSKSHYDALVHWFAKHHLVLLTDDLGRQMQVLPVSFTPTRAPLRAHPYRHTYQATIRVLAYGTVPTTTDPSPTLVLAPANAVNDDMGAR